MLSPLLLFRGFDAYAMLRATRKARYDARVSARCGMARLILCERHDERCHMPFCLR